MKNLIKKLLVIGGILSSVAAHADNKGRLFIIGDATSYGWELDKAQALISTSENPYLYKGTIYLKGGETNTFKFMESHEWGSTEYGIADKAAVSGEFQLVSGSLDDGYSQIYVAESGNYCITVDTESLTGDITRSDYQEREIKCTALFLVGGATKGGWSVEDGTPLCQSATAPYEYSATVPLKSDGSFKIATALRGAGSWDAKYYYFRDAHDPGKISTDSTDDSQWSVEADGDYTVTVNTIADTISLERNNGQTTGIEDVTITNVDDTTPVYYNLQGTQVANPSNGVFIKVVGNHVSKVILN